MIKVNKVQAGIVIVSILTSLVAYRYLPDTIASHWNLLGEVNGYSSKLSFLIGFPSLIIFLSLLLQIVPLLDPMKKNIEKFQKEFDKFISLMLGFFLLIQYQVILWSLGTQISFNILMPIILGVLMYAIGDLLGKSKRNWSIGIRTSWTLSSDKVWNSTHKLGAKLFKLSLPIFLVSALLPAYSFFIAIGYIIGISIFLVYYSYQQYKGN